jgi:hypothetical protein
VAAASTRSRGADLSSPATPVTAQGRDALFRLAVAITIAAGIGRLAVGALTPLFPDETYYWEWSRRLALGYFDHPPMIAWLIRLGTMVAGDTPLGVRLGPILVGTAGTMFAVMMARLLVGNRASLVAAAIFALMPLSAAGLVLATPDAPLLGGAAATLYAVMCALDNDVRSLESFKWWVAAGFALGFALLSKYTAVLIPLGVFIGLLTTRGMRSRFFEPGPYLAVAIALLLFYPVFLWNRDQNWASFAFQFGHGLGSAGGSVIKRELELVGGQLGLASPILFGLMAVAVWRAIRSRRDPMATMLAVVTLVIFAVFVYSASRRRVEANWPALAYIPGVALLVWHEPGRIWNRWLRAGLVLSAILTGVTYVNTFTPILPVPARRDPVARSHGWDHLARKVNTVWSPRQSISSYRTWVAADRYQDASALAFHLPNHPDVFSLNLTTRPNQYDFWPDFPSQAQPRDGLILVVDETDTPPSVALLSPHFASVRSGEPVTLTRDGDPVKHLRIWILDGWRGTWPRPRLRSRP